MGLLTWEKPRVTTASLALFPRSAGSAAALMGSLQMAMGFVGVGACGLLPDATAAMAAVPPVISVRAAAT